MAEQEIKPYPMKLNGESMMVVRNHSDRSEYLKNHAEVDPSDIGYVAIALFRKQDYVDYIAIAVVDDVENTESWTPVYEQYEMVDWFAGFTLRHNAERDRSLDNMHRKIGSFATSYGWNADVVVETEPTPNEWDNYISFLSNKPEPEDFRE